MPSLDRTKLRMLPLSQRAHKLEFERIAVDPDGPAPALDDFPAAQVRRTSDRIRKARFDGRPVMIAYGAHLVKNGLAPVVIRLIEEGWVTHIATNGAGMIHDWEFAFLGKSTEDVRANTAAGCFGTWEETGRYTNLAAAVGGVDGLGYGASVAKMIADDGLVVPSASELRHRIGLAAAQGRPDETLGALADLLYLVTTFGVPAGRIPIRHTHKHASAMHAAWAHGIPFTIHPGIGYDIVYTHPMNCGGAIGRGAVRDFLTYAESVSRLTGGVHLAVGSAIMAPMIFEKALSIANNLAMAEERETVRDHSLVVVDIQDGGDWDWSQGEPPMDNPAYYLRFCKTFYRMGGTLEYICLDNGLFLRGLYNELRTQGIPRQ